MSRPKHCPFCGSKALVLEVTATDHTIRYEVVCSKNTCRLAKAPSHLKYFTRAGAIRAWNRRPCKTCTIESYDSGYDALCEDYYGSPCWHLSCEHVVYGSIEPVFCSTCGRKVVSYEEKYEDG